MTARARPGGLVISTAGMATSHGRQESATNCQECHQPDPERCHETKLSVARLRIGNTKSAKATSPLPSSSAIIPEKVKL